MSWFSDLESAMKRRVVALNGLTRWQEKLDAAEAEIKELMNDQPIPAPGRVADAETVTTAGSEPVITVSATDPASLFNPGGIAADYADSAE